VFFDDPKKAAMTIMARRKADGSRTAAPMKPEEVKTEDGEIDGRHVAAQEIISAHHEGSAQKLMEAMGHFIDMHKSGGQSTPEK
jgi:hypothetical protein